MQKQTVRLCGLLFLVCGTLMVYRNSSAVLEVDVGFDCSLLVSQPDWISVGTLGRLVDGKFEESYYLSVWTVDSVQDVEGLEAFYYGQIVQPASRFAGTRPKTLTAHVLSIRADGKPVGKGVLVRFVLMSATPIAWTYRSEKRILLVGNAALEGETTDTICVAGDNRSSVEIMVPPD